MSQPLPRSEHTLNTPFHSKDLQDQPWDLRVHLPATWRFTHFVCMRHWQKTSHAEALEQQLELRLRPGPFRVSMITWPSNHCDTNGDVSGGPPPGVQITESRASGVPGELLEHTRVQRGGLPESTSRPAFVGARSKALGNAQHDAEVLGGEVLPGTRSSLEEPGLD